MEINSFNNKHWLYICWAARFVVDWSSIWQPGFTRCDLQGDIVNPVKSLEHSSKLHKVMRLLNHWSISQIRPQLVDQAVAEGSNRQDSWLFILQVDRYSLFPSLSRNCNIRRYNCRGNTYIPLSFCLASFVALEQRAFQSAVFEIDNHKHGGRGCSLSSPSDLSN